jgi:hypothetical protein
MRAGNLSSREEEIIRQLLSGHGIVEYELAEMVNEGQTLPGSSYPGEIEAISGYVVTATSVYMFWLDWYQGHYTLGEHRGFWEEVPLNKLGRDKERILGIQKRLQRGERPGSEQKLE